MLYAMYESQRRLIEPWRRFCSSTADLFAEPAGLLSTLPMARNVNAYYDLMARLAQRYHKPKFGIDHVEVGRRTVQVKERVVLANTFCNLVHFERDGVRGQPKVLVFAPLSGHFATLLRDTVRQLLTAHDVYITDWHNARDVPFAEGGFHFDDYVRYVREFIAALGPDVHVISVCQPTVPVLAGVSLMAADGKVTPKTLTLMGGPIDTRKNPTEVNTFALTRPLTWFEANVIHRVPVTYPGFLRRVYPGFLQLAGFIAMNPDRHLDSHYQYYLHLVQGDGEGAQAHRQFYDEYLAVMDLPAEYYLETIVRVFHEHRLPCGDLEVAGELVRPEAISKSALLTVEGELDDISGSGQTEAAHGLTTGIPAKRHKHFLAEGVGHYGIFSGRKWRERIYPVVADFIEKHR